MANCGGKTNSIVLKSPIGNVLVEYCGRGVHALNLDDKVRDDSFLPGPKQRVVVEGKENQKASKDNIRDACITWLDTYFHEPSKLSQIARPTLCLDGTTFSNNCWVTLPELADFGKVVSYTELAAAAGNEKAIRAAGGSDA
ncbi:methylated-DNA--protein-cysteine methyltransferase-like [Paramacrobiotus metropolitanus]|uniref:methylated-DNA--protein-cysteine methyltransferase-like n=1 Tax=Paramacrobiotus metropolitanus TaxID=2943436 RepID=UPI0024459C09|nr:methylated-DNA--protein-cysteine methyltransferase-like [Paramacrobiotus metropolitanus]